MIVYLVTNKTNGMQYVGQTVRDFKRRWANHLSDAGSGSTHYFHKSIRKYGNENFSACLLHTCNTKEEMDFVETFYIHLLGTKAPNGYNSTEGGDGTLGWNPTEETRRRMSESASIPTYTDSQIAYAYNSSINFVEGSKLIGMQPSPFGKRCRALGLTAKGRKYERRIATCHPEIEHYAFGLCLPCYKHEYGQSYRLRKSVRLKEI